MSDFDFTFSAYTAQLAQKKLVGSHCKNCGHFSVPSKIICPECRSTEVEPHEFSGKGKLAAFSVIYFGPTFMKDFGYGPQNPYVAGIVDLEEGPRVSAQILGLDIAHPESIQIGTPLAVAFIERGEGDAKKVVLGFQA